MQSHGNVFHNTWNSLLFPCQTTSGRHALCDATSETTTHMQKKNTPHKVKPEQREKN